MTVVVLRKRESKKSTQSSIGGLVTGNPVAVASKLENSVAFLHLRPLQEELLMQRYKIKFGLSLLRIQIGN